MAAADRARSDRCEGMNGSQPGHSQSEMALNNSIAALRHCWSGGTFASCMWLKRRHWSRTRRAESRRELNSAWAASRAPCSMPVKIRRISASVVAASASAALSSWLWSVARAATRARRLRKSASNRTNPLESFVQCRHLATLKRGGGLPQLRDDLYWSCRRPPGESF